jgi:hypothetical protein
MLTENSQSSISIRGKTDPVEILQQHLDYWVGLYEQEVKHSEFAPKVDAGSGPDCGAG